MTPRGPKRLDRTRVCRRGEALLFADFHLGAVPSKTVEDLERVLKGRKEAEGDWVVRSFSKVL